MMLLIPKGSMNRGSRRVLNKVNDTKAVFASRTLLTGSRSTKEANDASETRNGALLKIINWEASRYWYFLRKLTSAFLISRSFSWNQRICIYGKHRRPSTSFGACKEDIHTGAHFKDNEGFEAYWAQCEALFEEESRPALLPSISALVCTASPPPRQNHRN